MMESDKVSEELEADKSSSTEAMLPSEDGGPPVPRYSINFTDNVSKDGDVIQYTINVRKLEEDTEDNNIITLVREYEDIQFLDHQLVAHNRQAGLIFPSLPAKPVSDPAGAESRSKKQLGSSNRSILGDSSQWGRDCRVLEKYLEMVAAHPVLGRSTHLASFLESASPPPRPAKMKKGWMAGVRDKWDSRNATAKDCDETFAKERDWALTYGSQIRDASEKFSAVVSARLRLIQQLGHLAGALSITVAGNEGANGVYNKLTSGFSGCIETIKTGVEGEVQAAEGTLGGYLELYSRCLEAENAMLLRRTCLMVDWENAAKAVEKARPNREEAAKAACEVAEAEFQACSQVAKGEVKFFHQRRLQELRQSLIFYVEGQIKCSRESQASLTGCLAKMKEFSVPQVKDSMFDPNDNE